MNIMIVLAASVCAIIMFCLCWTLIPIFLVLFLLARFYIQKRSSGLLPQLRATLPNGNSPLVVGFFHPYCNAGGGGERVLWIAIRSLQNRYAHIRCVVYTGDTDASREEILAKAAQRFNICLPRSGPDDVHFVFLNRRQWVEASPYPILTLLGQSLGSLILGMEALLKFVPDVYVDTMGYAFTLPLFRFLGGSKVGCYVHYPTISTDMLQRVSARTESYNNTSIISRSPFLSKIKLIYYKLFAFIYGLAGKCSSVIMVNSSWTYGHIVSIWNCADKTNIVYPPCDVQEFLTIPLVDHLEKKEHSIVSLGQFRPEKDHALQVKSFAAFLDMSPAEKRELYKLVLIGGCRNEGDEKRVESLKKLCEDLSVKDNVEFRLNVSFPDLKNSLADATIGLHTMWNEHFGIGVVECMAGGTIMLAHESGGPKLDIVKDFNGQKTGFLADDVKSYSKAMMEILNLSPTDRIAIRTAARESVVRFSDNEFRDSFLSVTESLFA